MSTGVKAFAVNAFGVAFALFAWAMTSNPLFGIGAGFHLGLIAAMAMVYFARRSA